VHDGVLAPVALAERKVLNGGARAVREQAQLRPKGGQVGRGDAVERGDDGALGEARTALQGQGRGEGQGQPDSLTLLSVWPRVWVRVRVWARAWAWVREKVRVMVWVWAWVRVKEWSMRDT